MTRIYSRSLGCPKNRVDTEHALGALCGIGPIEIVAEPEDAELVFINTCGFIAPAVEESVRAMVEVIDRLQAMPVAERPFLAVAGCLVGRYGQETIGPDLPEVDLFLDTSALDQWGALLTAAMSRKSRPDAAHDGIQPASSAPLPHRLLSTGPSYAWLKISDGCRHNCSFCTIPMIRGPLRSTPAEALADEARALLEGGVRELALVAQDLTAWGADLGGRPGLPRLLEALLPLPGLARLRLMYLYPAGITKELLAFLQQAGPPFVPYFDVPLQHSAPGVLSRMGRPFAGNPRLIVDRIREAFPEASLRTSLIVGFPGESPADFDDLCAFVEETRFQHLGVFAYQAEEGTAAAAMPGQLDMAEKERRRDVLMGIQKDISEDMLRQYVGQRMEILVDAPQGEWPGLHLGRAWFQAPEIDGQTYVSGPGVEPGALVQAEIVESATYDLTALAE
jgi:tRNA-2-methylthio-N6-dimethylallyladenosine synthase/ribosomal protein S12 methylthiotransferase